MNTLHVQVKETLREDDNLDILCRYWQQHRNWKCLTLLTNWGTKCQLNMLQGRRLMMLTTLEDYSMLSLPLKSWRGMEVSKKVQRQYSRTSPCGHPTTVDTPPKWTLYSRPVWFSLYNPVYQVSLVWTVDTSPVWTVFFCPKVGFYLGNMDTKFQNFEFGVHIT